MKALGKRRKVFVCVIGLEVIKIWHIYQKKEASKQEALFHCD